MWNIPNSANKVYLTFDDGPTEEITTRTLELLEEYNAKATFFCVGKQVEKNPKIYQDILDRGHAVGNHSDTHMNGLHNTNEDYFADIKEAEKVIDSNLFRPPYGKIKRSQNKVLTEKYHTIMWDVLPGDFDKKHTPEDLIETTLKHTEAGSIIVLHDSLKHGPKMLKALPAIMEGLSNKGFILDKIQY